MLCVGRWMMPENERGRRWRGWAREAEGGHGGDVRLSLGSPNVWSSTCQMSFGSSVSRAIPICVTRKSVLTWCLRLITHFILCWD